MNVCPKCNSINAKSAWLECDPRGEKLKTCKDCGCRYTKEWVWDGGTAIHRNEYEKQRHSNRL